MLGFGWKTCLLARVALQWEPWQVQLYSPDRTGWFSASVPCFMWLLSFEVLLVTDHLHSPQPGTRSIIWDKYFYKFNKWCIHKLIKRPKPEIYHRFTKAKHFYFIWCVHACTYRTLEGEKHLGILLHLEKRNLHLSLRSGNGDNKTLVDKNCPLLLGASPEEWTWKLVRRTWRRRHAALTSCETQGQQLSCSLMEQPWGSPHTTGTPPRAGSPSVGTTVPPQQRC